MPDLVSRLRGDLTTAMRQRDRDRVRVLRTVLAAIANAEARPDVDDTPLSLRSAAVIAGAADGLGASEAPRRELDEAGVLTIVRAERDERLATAGDLESRGASDAARTLRAEAAMLGGYLP